MAIKENFIKEYWKKRSLEQGYLTVGNGGLPKENQDLEYIEKSNFIFTHCPRNMKTIDYGCGVGRYSSLFDDYIGVDITESLLDYAKKENPDKKYILLDNPIFNIENALDFNYFTKLEEIDFELFFTSTVLQHSSDDVVRSIFQNIKKIKKPPICFCFYENDSQGESYHVKCRTSSDYSNILSEFYTIDELYSYSHVVHGEKHTLTLIKSYDNNHTST